MGRRMVQGARSQMKPRDVLFFILFAYVLILTFGWGRSTR